ncbi:MAG: hypothetical protein JKY45_13130 [Emcibacter sp.]|nr:hypothetical protein [Emcibacter sp.]
MGKTITGLFIFHHRHSGACGHPAIRNDFEEDVFISLGSRLRGNESVEWGNDKTGNKNDGEK